MSLLASIPSPSSGTLELGPFTVHMVWMWTDDEAVDIVVKRTSAEDDIAPWVAGRDAKE